MEKNLINISDFILFCRITKNLCEKTLTAYLRDLTAFHNYMLKNEDSSIYDYILHLISLGLKTTTIKRHISTLSQFHKYLYRNNISENPMPKLDFKLKTDKLLPRTITTYEVKKLFDTLYKFKENNRLSNFQKFNGYRDIAIIDLLCSTGIRIGEAAAITLSDIDIRTKIIIIHGKGKKERLAYLSCSETVENIKEWLFIRKRCNITHDYLFVTKSLAPMTARDIGEVFNKYKAIAKINPSATAHSLRHTFATNLLANGADLRSVQELLGHASISITERYTEVTTQQKIKILKKYNFRNNINKH